jgi:hypothetical protein
MTRIRTVKPELFSHEALFEAEQQTKLPLRLAFIGLLTCCDREGRFRWRPRQLKLNILPYDDSIDFEAVLEALVVYGFVVKYQVDNQYYGYFPSWHKHQRVNNKEAESDLPAVSDDQIISVLHTSSTREPREAHACVTRESSVKHACPTENQSAFSSLNSPSGEGERNREEERKGKEEEGNGDSPAQSSEVDAQPPPSPPVVIAIPLNSGGEYPITQSQILQWESLYPAVDVMQTLRSILGWNLANPKKRKTKSGILQHINTWLAKDQNHPGKQTSSANNRAPPYKPPNDLQEYNARVAEQWMRESESKIVDGEIIK